MEEAVPHPGSGVNALRPIADDSCMNFLRGLRKLVTEVAIVLAAKRRTKGGVGDVTVAADHAHG